MPLADHMPTPPSADPPALIRPVQDRPRPDTPPTTSAVPPRNDTPGTVPSAPVITRLDLGIGGPHCVPQSGHDIVVCAPDPETFRLRTTGPQTAEPLLPRAQVRIGTATLDIHGESATMANGVVVNRAMVGLKLPF